MNKLSQLLQSLNRLLQWLAPKRAAGNGLGLGANSPINEARVHASAVGRESHNAADFLVTASRVMRQKVVDRARLLNSQKPSSQWRDVLILDELLGVLSKTNARSAQVAEMQVFLKVKDDEIAAALNVSARTVKREAAMARAWLKNERKGD